MKYNKLSFFSSVLAAVLSSSLLLSFCYTTAFQENTDDSTQYTISQLQSLSDTILNKSESEEWMDINNDGIINSFDMALLRTKMINRYYATEENVRYIGRNLYSDNTAWLVQSGSAIEFTVTAKSAEITFVGDKYFKGIIDESPRYAVFVDGELLIDEVLMEKNKTISLFSEDTDKTAVVKVIHLSEGMYATFGISEIKVNSSSDTPITPAEKKNLQIEFIGDSLTCGYGVEGTENSSFSTSTENFMKTYAYLACEALDADYSTECNSGYGILSGVTFDGTKDTEKIHPPIYCNYGIFTPYDVPWVFESHPNDIVVLNIGTNDASYTRSIPKLESEFKEEYIDFLKLIHENNPEAYIICTVGTIPVGTLMNVEKTAVEEFRKTTGWDKILFYESVQIEISDGYGSDKHPTEITQRKNAERLVQVIKGILDETV